MTLTTETLQAFIGGSVNIYTPDNLSCHHSNIQFAEVVKSDGHSYISLKTAWKAEEQGNDWKILKNQQYLASIDESSSFTAKLYGDQIRVNIGNQASATISKKSEDALTLDYFK